MAPAAPVTATWMGFFAVAAAAEEANRRASRREAMIDEDTTMLERAMVAGITNGWRWGTRISRWMGQVAVDVRRQGGTQVEAAGCSDRGGCSYFLGTGATKWSEL